MAWGLFCFLKYFVYFFFSKSLNVVSLLNSHRNVILKFLEILQCFQRHHPIGICASNNGLLCDTWFSPQICIYPHNLYFFTFLDISSDTFLTCQLLRCSLQSLNTMLIIPFYCFRLLFISPIFSLTILLKQESQVGWINFT